MKKKLVLIGIITLLIFLVGCAQEKVEIVDEEGNVVGEAIQKVGKYQIQLKKPIEKESKCEDLGCKLECETFGFNWEEDNIKQFNGAKTPNQLCQNAGYDTASLALDIGQVPGAWGKDLVYYPYENKHNLEFKYGSLGFEYGTYVNHIVGCCRIS